MLIQLTNTCQMGCPHCLQDSLPQPMHMTEETCVEAIKFWAKSGAHVVNLSGGEPTEHPQFERILELWTYAMDETARTTNTPYALNIITNGEWIHDRNKVKIIKDFLAIRRFGHLITNVQISSFKGLYKNYNDIQKHKKTLLAIKGITIADEGILNMCSLGRAKNHEPSKKAAAENPYHMSCFMFSQVKGQCKSLPEAVVRFEITQHFCSPMVDWKGNVHCSESWLCPSCGHCTDEDIEQKIMDWKPCGGCADYQKMMKRDDTDMRMARLAIGI